MANYENEINSWPVLKNGLHYKWLVDYAAFSAFGTSVPSVSFTV